jgi:hypothetical protein
VFNGLHGELGGDFMAVDFSEVGTDETNPNPTCISNFLFMGQLFNSSFEET